LKNAVAIIGMACRYPEARTPTELWENVLAKRRAFRRLPSSRLRSEDYYSPERDAVDRHDCTQAALLEGYEFDRLRFRVAGSTYRSTDLTHWLALETAADALADAGFPDGEGLPRETTGVLLGNSLTGEFSRANLMRLRWPYVRRVLAAALLEEEGWSEERCEDFLEHLEGNYKRPFPPITEETLAGGLANTIAGRISNHFDLQGGGYTVDGACSSSLLAVIQAATALVGGDLDVAVAGGVDLSIDPFELVGFAKNGALAREEMRVFDARSAGFWPGEGCGVVVLARLEDALAGPHRIYAVLRGWGISSDGHGGLTRPEQEGQLLALRRAYDRAGFGIDTIGYFEGHGTGTAVGDATELGVLSTARRQAGAEKLAALGSLKANIGHTKAAAGVAGLIKAALAIDRQVLPPHVGCDEPHPHLTAEGAALKLLSRAEPWPEDVELRAAVSAMGFGGINAHVVLEGLATSRRPRLDAFEESLLFSSQDAELFLLAAASREQLLAQVDELVELAAGIARSQLADMAAELVRRLVPGRMRAAVVASRPEELARRLTVLGERLRDNGAVEPGKPYLDVREGLFVGHVTSAPRLGFLFPGQGSPAHLSGGALRERFEPVAELGDADGAMAAIRAGSEDVEALLAEGATVSAINSPHQTIISGPSGAVSATCSQAHRRGIKTHRLKVSHAFHSPLVAAAAEPLEQYLDGVEFDVVQRPVASPTCGRLLRRDDDLRQLLLRQISEPILFSDAVAAAGDVDLWIEVGPGHVLSHLVTDLVQDTAGRDRVIAIDAGGPSLGGTLRAVGAAFALGTRIHARMLFAGRFTRPFDLDRPPRFLENPCEAAPLPGGLHSARVRRTSEAAEAAPQVATPTAAPGTLAETRSAETRSAETRSAEREGDEAGEAAETAETPLQLVRSLVAKRAELPLEAIRESSRMLSDLHLSSIAVGQIVIDAARQLGLSSPTAPTEFADATLAELSEALATLAATAHGEDDALVGLPSGVDAWVRPFTVELVERPLPSAGPGVRPAGEGWWQVLAPPNHPTAAALEEAFATSYDGGGAGLGDGGGVVLCLPAEVGEEHLSLFVDATRAVVAQGQRGTFMVVQEDGGGGGFARTLHLEMPGVDTTVCNLPLADPRAPTWVVQEARAASGYREAHYDDLGVRREGFLRAFTAEAADPSPLTAEDILLVTGGGKGIAAECALALAQDAGPRLVLLGRSRPEDDEELRTNLERMTAAKISWRYFPTDVTDADAVADAVRQTEEEFGPVTAFLHGAGLNVPQLVTSLDEEAYRRTLGPKLRGAENVLRALDPQRLRLCVAFGSIIARTGMKGEAHYALANEWLERRIRRHAEEHSGCRCLTLEWSVWSGVGMGERLGRIEALVREGITPIPPDAGVRLFLDLLQRPCAVTSLVVAGRFGEAPALRPELPELPMQRFLEKPRVFYPGVELVVDCEVSAETDPYLEDHVYRGERLLPAVMGLEAMTQVAQVLTGTSRLPVFEDVHFDRPVAVPEGQSVTLRLAALVLSSPASLQDTDAAQRVDVVLRSSATGFAVDHFRASCCFPTASTVADQGGRLFAEWSHETERLPIEPADDLYGGVLFHQGRFRRVSAYRRLRATECLAEISPQSSTHWFGAYLPSETVLGDPAIRDAALHGVQASIPHGTILPVGVDRIVTGRLKTSEPLLLAARERQRNGRDFLYDLEITDFEGRLRERWEGLRLRAVDNIVAPPDWATPLLAPYVERRLEELIPGTGVAVALERYGGNGGNGNTRRRASDHALGRLLGPGAPVRRRADGRPTVCGGRVVSVSHAEELVLAVVASGALGCDLEAVKERSTSLWRELLGEERYLLAKAMADAEGEDLNTTATRIWTAAECLKKAGALHNTPLVFNSSTADGWQLYRAGSQSVGSVVMPIRELGGPAALTVLCTLPAG